MENALTVKMSESKKTRRFKHWAHLNDEGMKIWGEVFPKRSVPVESMMPQSAKLEGKAERVFMVWLDELSEDQTTKLVDILENQFNAPRDKILDELQRVGLPLRESLTSGSATDHPGFFF